MNESAHRHCTIQLRFCEPEPGQCSKYNKGLRGRTNDPLVADVRFWGFKCVYFNSSWQFFCSLSIHHRQGMFHYFLKRLIKYMWTGLVMWEPTHTRFTLSQAIQLLQKPITNSNFNDGPYNLNQYCGRLNGDVLSTLYTTICSLDKGLDCRKSSMLFAITQT